jgi:hypothetical protein
MNGYDVIVIGSGAGGGTLVHRLAPSGKRILLLERGDWLPREPANWFADEVFVDGAASTPFTYLDKGALAVVGRNRAVCEIRGLKLWGPPAFFTYLAVHLYYLGGPRGRRVEVLMKWIGARFGQRRSALIESDLNSVERVPPGAQPVP